MQKMIQYYLGGYYQLVLRDIDFGRQNGKVSYTCSTCINESLFGDWSFSWATRSYKTERKIKKEFNITDQAIESIRNWIDDKLDKKKIGWSSVFADVDTAKAYRQQFFAHLPAVELMAIYFDDRQHKKFSTNCATEVKYGNLSLTGLADILSRKIPEPCNEQELAVGFDLIGVEISGDFHSFQCQDWTDIANSFNLQLNEYGLLNDCEDWQPVLDYLNDDQNGFEPVPWFVVKVKRVSTDVSVPA